MTRAEDVCQNPNANVYAGRVSNAEIGMSNMINWAVGLYPCNLLVNPTASADHVPSYDTHPIPATHRAMVSTLDQIELEFEFMLFILLVAVIATAEMDMSSF